VDVWWFGFGCVVVFFVGWILIYGTWIFGVDLWWLLEKIFDVWWFWSILKNWEDSIFKYSPFPVVM
jgi:hypothetical protein